MSCGSGAWPRRQTRPNSPTDHRHERPGGERPEHERAPAGRQGASAAPHGTGAGLARRDAHHEHARGHVARDDGAGGDERLLADLDRRQQDGSRPDPAATPQGRPAELDLRRAAAGRGVVREHHAGGDEDVVLDLGPGRDVRARLHADARADADVVLDRGPAAHHGLVADMGALAHVGLVGDDAALAHPRPGHQDRARSNRRLRAHHGRPGRRASRGARARAERNRLAHHAAVLEPRPGTHDAAGVDDHVPAQLDVLGQLDALADQESWRALRGPQLERHALRAVRGWAPRCRA